MLRLLDPDAKELEALPAPEQGERWRLLAFAASRLDQRAAARKAFARWIALAPSHRLERASTPPGIYADYAAALIDALGADLDRTPQLEPRAQVPVPVPTPAEWPRFAPPPRSARDNARDFLFAFGLLGSVHLKAAAGSPVDHLGAQLGVELEPWQRWRFGFQFAGLRWVDQFSRARVLVQARSAWAPLVRGIHRLDVVAAGGMGLSTEVDEGSVVAVGAALRYHLQPARTAAGFYIEVGDQVGIASRVQHVAVVALGIVLQPARSVPPRDVPR